MFQICSLKSNKSIPLIVFGLALSGCNRQAPESAAEPSVASLQKEINDLRGDLIQRTMRADKAIELTPTEKEFQFLDTPAGKMAFSVESIAAQGDGSELTFNVGNLSSATVNTFKFDAEWGAVDGNGFMVRPGSRTGQKTISKPLLPGTWNTVKIAFAGIPPSGFGRLSIANPEVSNLSMNTN